jgi:hypothetical protein
MSVTKQLTSEKLCSENSLILGDLIAILAL